MPEANMKRVEILIQQSRYQEAKEELQSHLADYPDHFLAQYYLAAVMLELGEKKESREMCEILLEEEPDDFHVLSLAISIDLADELFTAAESKAEILLQKYPYEADSYLKMARVKLGQRNYDRALEFTNKALALEPEDIDALNLKILIGGMIGDDETNEAIEEALQLDPESASTIANQGLQLLREGRVKEALDRLEYALSLDPTNQLARLAMIEALKSRFWPYRLFFKFAEFSAKLSAKASWGMLIGVYIAYRILLYLSENNEFLKPILTPLVYVVIGLFLLTWVTDPLMNLYLLTNKYGKLLLDEDDKKMARFTGISLLVGLVSFGLSFLFPNGPFVMLGILGMLCMIPLGSFLKPSKPSNRRTLTFFTMGIVGVGLLGVLSGNTALLTLAFIGLFIYQWVINGMIINENSRVFGD